MLLGCVLRKAGFTMIEAEDGESALQHLGAGGGAISLMITDLRLPDMRGDELCVRARGMREDLGVLICSGSSADPAMFRRLGGTGLSAFLAKPFMPPQLLACVRRLLVGGGALAPI